MNDKITEQYAVLMRLNKNLDEFYRSYAAKVGMSPAAFWVLYALCEEDTPRSQQDLCDDWLYPKQTINSAVNSLIKLDYVKLSPVEGTRNRKNVVLTPNGKLFCEAHIYPILSAERKAFAQLSEDEREQFLLIFQKQIVYLREEIK